MNAVPNCVRVQLFVNEEPRDFSRNGYVGRITAGDIVQVAVIMPRKRLDLHVFSADGAGHIQVRKEARTENGQSDETRTYVLTVPTGADNRGQPRPCRDNRLRILQLSPTGEYHLWDVGIFSQEGSFWLIGLETDAGQCCWDGANVVLPHRCRSWPEFERYVGKLVSNALNLPSSDSYEPPQRPYARPNPGEGIVEWFNPLVGIGAVLLHDGKDARVHWTQIGMPEQPRFLLPGQSVRYKNLVPAQQTNDRSTTFKLELKGVEVL